MTDPPYEPIINLNTLAIPVDDETVTEGASKQSDDLDGRLKTAIFKKAPLLPQADLLGLFDEIARLLGSAVTMIANNTTFAESYLAEHIIIPIATGMTQGRAYLRVKGKRKKKMSQGWQTLPILFPKPLQLFREEEHKHLSRVPALLASWVFERNRRTLVKHINESGIMRAILEEMVIAFLDIVVPYPVLDLSLAHHISEYGGIIGSAVPTFYHMQTIEEKVGGNMDTLSAVVRNVYQLMQEVVEIQHRIATSYYRIVYKFAAKISNVPNSIKDNFQNGIPGLHRAITYYEAEKGSFAQFAKQWVRQSLLLHVKKAANTIQVPSVSWQRWKKIEEARGLMYAKHGKVDPEMVVHHTGFSEKKIDDVDQHIQTAFALSLNFRLEDSEGNTVELIDTIASPEREDEEEETPASKDLLSKKERRLIGLMYGMWELMPAGASNRELTREYMRQKWHEQRRVQ